jgi:hypothetical protein
MLISPYLFVFINQIDNSVTESAFQFFNCVNVDGNLRVLAVSPAINCDSDQWKRIQRKFTYANIYYSCGMTTGCSFFLTLPTNHLCACHNSIIHLCISSIKWCANINVSWSALW